MLIEIFGYLGSTLVVVSMLMSSVVKLRVINTIGSFISAIYALIIHSYPLALMNICLIAINLYNLGRLLKSERHYDLIDGKSDDSFLAYLLSYYKNDIQKFFPEMIVDIASIDIAYIVCCDAAPAGVLLGKRLENNVLDISIDYATPTYRDCSVGGFLYSKLIEKGINKLVFSKASEEHKPYLHKMGFINENGIYAKYLS